ncbi:hypothetical protein DV736_g3241, partial [Chaetothyriales sp. CBS 134916]
MPDGIKLAADFYQPDMPADRKAYGLIYALCKAYSQAVVKWMREQLWYPGKFVQWALLRDPPEDLKASVNLCSVYDHSLVYRTDRIPWSYVVARQDEAKGGGISSVLNTQELKSVIEATSLFDATKRFFNGKAPYTLEFMTAPNVDDPF